MPAGNPRLSATPSHSTHVRPPAGLSVGVCVIFECARLPEEVALAGWGIDCICSRLRYHGFGCESVRNRPYHPLSRG